MGPSQEEEAPATERDEGRGPISGRGVLVMLFLALVVFFLGIFVVSWVLFMP